MAELRNGALQSDPHFTLVAPQYTKWKTRDKKLQERKKLVRVQQGWMNKYTQVNK